MGKESFKTQKDHYKHIFPKKYKDSSSQESIVDTSKEIYENVIKEEQRLLEKIQSYIKNKRGLFSAKPTGDRITSLTITGCGLDKIPEEVNYFTELKHLTINYNEIEKIENIDELTALESITGNYNNIKKIENLDNCKYLYSLNLSNNQIEKIENLDNLVKLRILALNKNNIRKIENLDNLKELVALSIEDNKIEEIEGTLDNIPKLASAFLAKNKIDRKANEEYIKKLYNKGIRVIFED